MNPTDKQIHEAISALDVRRDGLGFVILGRSKLTYLQVSGDNSIGCAMEYQEGGVTKHYRAGREDFSLLDVVGALSEYRDGAIDWSACGAWHQITW